MSRMLRCYRNFMSTRNRNLFLLEIIFLVICIVFLIPLLDLGMRYAMHLWGQSYITSANALPFLTSPPTLLLLLLIIILISFFLLFQMIVMIHYCNSEKKNQKPNIIHLLIISFMKAISRLRSGNIALPFYAVCLFLFMNLPFLIGTTIRAKFDLPGGASDAIFIKALLLSSFVLLAFVSFRGMFVIHFCINEHQGFLNALELSKTLLRGRNLRTARIMLIYNLCLTISYFAVYYMLLLIAALFVFLFVEKSMVITVFIAIYPRINGAASIFFHMTSFITNLNLITTLYTKYREEEFLDILPIKLSNQDLASLAKVKKHKHVLSGFLLFVITAGLFHLYFTINNDSLYLKETLTGIQISSHRGNSHIAPENTLPALENAIIARSDYAEIDIRQTKDGFFVLLHDKSLLRTAGLNMNIKSLNLNELARLDAGSWFGKEFIKTRIPTLEEALKLCKGRIKLNIEVKADQRTDNYEESLVALISEYDYEHQCLISSSDYNTLVKIKQLNADLKTGLILSAAYGNFYSKEYIDFFSIRSHYITRQVVESAHYAGKEVHAWTVNNVNEIERMKSIGVDCIITDNPTLTREILSQDDTSKTFIELLNRILKNRSFYMPIPN